MRPDSALSEAMDMDVNVAAVDASPPDETLNTGPSEVDVVTSLREEENMGSKGMSVDESHRSEAGTPSQAPAPIVRCLSLRIVIIDDYILPRLYLQTLRYHHAEIHYA